MIMAIRQNCEVHRHEFTVNFTQLPSNQDKTYFKDLTENHFKALVNVNFTFVEATGAVIQVIVTDRNNAETPFAVPLTTVGPGGQAGQVAIQVEDVRAIAIRYTSPSTVFSPALGSIDIVKDFCICC